ncbi:MAG: phenylacetate-CoA oxygenase subunit PaaI [Bacteroidetes bacterium]|nr:MAG: phenylacetate-CoA oxygenase subunit PaaI [Bacteroidota bacterium]
MNEQSTLAIKELLYKMADDLLILGHRNSEWTGIGPMLEEDIAFSSMAQDKIGQSLALYQILNTLGEADPDTVAFTRNAPQFHNCQLVEFPIGEYDFSLVRHFLFDNAELIRYEMLAQSSYEPLAKVARKFKGELKYHKFHGDTFLMKLGQGTAESKERMQKSLNEAWNYALGIFESVPHESTLIAEGVWQGEAALKARWIDAISPILEQAGLEIPAESTWAPVYGGLQGEHTEHLQPLLDEMSEVFRVDPTAEW